MHQIYVPTEIAVRRESAKNAVLTVYRLVTIRAGDSVRVRVLFRDACGFEGIPCRPILVEAAAGELINLEVSPVETGDQFGLMVDFPLDTPPLQTKLMVRDGAAWIVRGAGSSGTGVATVVARRP